MASPSAKISRSFDVHASAVTVVAACPSTVVPPPFDAATSTDAPVSAEPSAAAASRGGIGVLGPGGGVGAVPKVIWIGAAAVAPDDARIEGWAMVTVYGVLPTRWWTGVMTSLLPCNE